MLWQRELNRWTLGDSNPRPPALIAGGKLRKHRSYFVEKNIVGGRGGTRTRGPLLAKQVLSQLSYTPTSSELLTFYDTYAAASSAFSGCKFGTIGTTETSSHAGRTNP